MHSIERVVNQFFSSDAIMLGTAYPGRGPQLKQQYKLVFVGYVTAQGVGPSQVNQQNYSYTIMMILFWYYSLCRPRMRIYDAFPGRLHSRMPLNRTGFWYLILFPVPTQDEDLCCFSRTPSFPDALEGCGFYVAFPGRLHSRMPYEQEGICHALTQW